MTREQVADAVPLEPFQHWLRAAVPACSGPLTITHLSGGSSNLTLRVRDAEHELRHEQRGERADQGVGPQPHRGAVQFALQPDQSGEQQRAHPPLGEHEVATANDMGREFRVQRALRHSAVPVATTVAMCDDPTVIGAPFYLMEFVAGTVYSDADAVADLTPQQQLAATDHLIDVLAALHAAPAAAYPNYWISFHLDANMGLGCIDHPTTATLSAGHGQSGLASP